MEENIKLEKRVNISEHAGLCNHSSLSEAQRNMQHFFICRRQIGDKWGICGWQIDIHIHTCSEKLFARFYGVWKGQCLRRYSSLHSVKLSHWRIPQFSQPYKTPNPHQPAHCYMSDKLSCPWMIPRSKKGALFSNAE